MKRHLLVTIFKKQPILILVLFLFTQISISAQQFASYKIADSLYSLKAYKKASIFYKLLVRDTSTDAFHLNRYGYALYKTHKYPEAFQFYQKALASHPNPAVKASVLSRLSMIYAQQNNTSKAVEFLDSAITSGYLGVNELDSSEDFKNIRKAEDFKRARNKLYNSMFPCANDTHAREFDFWIGEWNVFQTGTSVPVGHSIIQKISGGCAILENWKSQVSEGKSLNFIDDSTGKWKQVWVGSYPNGKQDFINGVYKDKVMQFDFYTKDASGKPLLGRFRFFNQGPNQVRQFSETSTDGGLTWTTNYDFTYKRVK